MLEDALKNTRNIHRLLLTISFVTIIFSLSIDYPRDKEKQLAALEKLSAVPFLDYKDFVEKVVGEFEKSTLELLGEQINTRLEQENYTLFSTHHIGESFKKNVHTGRILTEELFFTNLNNASLNAFATLNGMSIGSDVQVLVPQIDELMDELIIYLSQNAGIGRRVDGLYITYGEASFTAESFLPGDEVYITLYFELPATASLAGHPVFNAQFPAKIHTIPNTSFTSWLNNIKEAEGLYLEEEGQLQWLGFLENLPSGFQEEKIGLLKRRLENDINSSSPEEQKVSILGASVPGVLFIFASPLLLLSLNYYLMNSALHLRKMADSSDEEDKKMFKAFSWPPLSLRKGWKYEAVLSLYLIPLSALFILTFQLARFGFDTLSSMLVVLFAVLIMCIPIKVTWNCIEAIRASLIMQPPNQRTECE